MAHSFKNWIRFTLGTFFFWVGVGSLITFVESGYAKYGPAASFPLELHGEAAALMYVLWTVLGALFALSGFKGLRSK